MATSKKKPVAKKKAPTRKPTVKKAATRNTKTVTRKLVLTRSDEYTQLTWVLISIWLVLIAVFLGTVVGKL